MLRLPVVLPPKISPIDWTGLPRRFLHPGELEILIALMRLVRHPRRAVEIGVNEGRTAAAALRSLPDLECYIGVDVRPGYVPSCPVQRNERPARPGHYAERDPRFRLILGPRGSLDLMPHDLGGEADIMFIDGDHGCVAVEHDSALALDIVRPGGIIIWHDYH